MIVAFSGTVQNGYPIDTDSGLADTDWHVCDGTNGTPDLRGRFVLGMSNAHTAGSIGGEETHKLTLKELPVDASKGYAGSSGWVTATAPTTTYVVAVSSMSNSGSVQYTGGLNQNWSITRRGSDEPHNNMPPYYALAYIMRL